MSTSLAAAVALVIALSGSTSISSETPNVHLSESQAAASSTATDPNADIVAQWQDINGTNFFVRVGTYNAELDQGFGMTKIIAKHGIYSWQSVEYVTKNASTGEAQGMDFTRVAYANKIACGTGGCEVLETVAVRAVMSQLFVTTYYGVDVNAEIGVKTMYCIGYDGLCPSWVNVALDDPARSANATQFGAKWTYEPLAVGAELEASEAREVFTTE